MQSSRPYAVSLVALAVVAFGAPSSSAQEDRSAKSPKNIPVIYLSKPSRMGFTQGQAERMGLKDLKGVPLVKATALPRGYKMAPVTMGRKHETTKKMKTGKP